ncbi:MAG: hypothetical protein NG747_14185 [Candidatus Brocadia sp.]|nr:hypothetical protein [Candidatus Brocadia sp.]
MFRLVIFTENEPHFMLPLIHQVCEELCGEMTIVAIVVSERFGGRSLFSNIKRFFPLMRTKGLILTVMDELKYRILRIFKKKYKHSLNSISLGYNIPLYPTSDVNSNTFEQTLKSLKPDLGVSISFAQIFKSNIIRIPKKGIINIHASLLPKYRGLMPNFWVLLNGEKETGITIHYIDEGIDTGRVILQERIAIPQHITYYQITQLSKKFGGKYLINTIQRIKSNKEIPSFSLTEKGNYCGFPKKQDFEDFWKKGLHYR